MKYKLLKKIDGVDWEVGETRENPRYNSNHFTGEEGVFLSEIDIHNLLLNGTIEKVEENKRWRAEKGGEYYYVGNVGNVGTIRITADWYYGSDNALHELGNYFRTKEQAQEVADKIKQILKESHERN